MYEEVTQGLGEEIEGRQKEEADKELDRMVREKRERKRRRRSKFRAMSKLNEEYSYTTKVGLRNFDLSLENLHDEERSTAIRRKFHMLKQELTTRAYSLLGRLRLFHGTITPTVLYGCSSWTMTTDK